MVAPICLFVYNRLDNVTRLIESLKENSLSHQSDLFIFSDGPKSPSDIESIFLVRKYLSSISGFNNVIVIEREQNFGLAKSVISGVSEVINKYGCVIVLEDDLILSNNFLSYMNQGLLFFRSNKLIGSISGYRPDFKIDGSFPFDAFFSYRITSWGWATWIDRWAKVDWNFESVFIKNKINLNFYGSDLSSLVNKQLSGKINSWAIRWFYFHLINNLFSIVPVYSKVQNIGFGESATHTKIQSSFFDVNLDYSQKKEFLFPKEFNLDSKVLAKKHISHYNYTNKIYHRLISILNRLFS